MARTYRRDARGRFAGGGYSGQTGGRGARLTASGTRKGGGARVKAAGVGGTVGKPRGLKPGAVKVKAGSESAANRRAMRAAGNYRRAAGAMGKGAMNKRTDVSLATASRALDVYRGKPITSVRRGLTSSGKRIAQTPAKPTVFRTRKQATAAQRDRNRQVAEIGAGLSKRGAPQSLNRKAVRVKQGNLLTGGTDKVVANVTTQRGSTRIGSSSFARKTQRRMDRVGARIDSLVAQRRNLPSKPRKSADQRAVENVNKRLARLSKAADIYRSAKPGGRRRPR